MRLTDEQFRRVPIDMSTGRDDTRTRSLHALSPLRTVRIVNLFLDTLENKPPSNKCATARCFGVRDTNRAFAIFDRTPHGPRHRPMSCCCCCWLRSTAASCRCTAIACSYASVDRRGSRCSGPSRLWSTSLDTRISTPRLVCADAGRTTEWR